MGKMVISELNVSEYQFYHDVIISLMKETTDYNFPNSEIDISYFENKYKELKSHLENHRAIVFIAKTETEVAGWLWCHQIDRFEKHKLHIAFFSVLLKWTGMGVGTALLFAAEEKAKGMNLEGVDLFVTASNGNAVQFYENHGYTVDRFLLTKEIV